VTPPYQLDLDAVPGGELGDHEEPEHLGQGEVDVGRLGQALVDLDQLLVAHAQALVLDLDQVAGGQRLAGHQGLGAGRREGDGVLDQLGQQVHDVGGGMAGELHVVEGEELDPGVLLDLLDRRLHDLGELDRAPPAPGRLRPGQDDQVLGVAPHPGGQMVQLAEPGPDLGRGAADLELVDHLELALDQALAAPGQVEEHVADAAAQNRLAARDPDRDPVDRVEGLGQVPDLVPGPDLDRRRRLGLEVDLLAVLEPLHDAGQPMFGRLLGRRLQPAHGPDQRAGGDEGQHHGQHQGGHQQQAVQPGPALGGLLDGRAGGDHVGAEALFDLAHPVELDAHDGEPGLGVDVQPRGGGASQRLLDELVGPADLRPGHGLLEELVLGLGGAGVELGHVELLGGDQGGQLAVLVLAEAVRGVDVLEQAALGVGEVLGPGQGDRGGDTLEQLGVVGAGGDLAVDVQQVADGVGVLVERLARGGQRAVALLGRFLELLLALLFVDLDARLDLQLLGIDPGAVDRLPLLAEAAQLAQAVLDLLGQQLVAGAEALGLGPVGGGRLVDDAPLLEQPGAPLPATAVDVADREAAFGLELVDEGGEAGGQPGEGGAPFGPVALGQVLADADQGEDGQQQQGAEEGDDELGADRRVAEHLRQPCVRRERKAHGRYRPCQDRGHAGICRASPGQARDGVDSGDASRRNRSR
jgi:hypothetical protein